jgi:hypothetical protein
VRAARIRAGLLRTALADFPARVNGGLPGGLRNQHECCLLPLAERPPDRVDELVPVAGTELVQLLDQIMAGAGPIAGDHQPAPTGRRDRRDRILQYLQVIRGSVRPGRAWPQHPRQRLARVITGGQQRMMPESFEIRLSQFLVRVRVHHGGVQPDAGDPGQLPVRHLHRRQLAMPGGDLGPGMPPCPVHRRGHLAPGPHPAAGDLLQRPPRRRHGRDLPEHLFLVTHHPEIADRPGAVGDRARQVREDTPPVQACVR